MVVGPAGERSASVICGGEAVFVAETDKIAVPVVLAPNYNLGKSREQPVSTNRLSFQLMPAVIRTHKQEIQER